MKSDVSRLRHVSAFSAGGVVIRRAAHPMSAGGAAYDVPATSSADGALRGVPYPPAHHGGQPDEQSDRYAALSSRRIRADAPSLTAAPDQNLRPPTGTRTAVEVALVGYPREHTWVLPKGTPALGETPEQTALREVREETGLEVRILHEIMSIFYTFTRRGVRFDKEVKHYLMVAVGGDVSLHDHEYDEARWFTFGEALRCLRHKNEVDVLLRAESFISAWLRAANAPFGADGKTSTDPSAGS